MIRHGVREEEDWNRQGAEPVRGGGDQEEVERIHGEQPGMGKVSEREERVKEERIFNTKKFNLLIVRVKSN
jgi:hypothetical protein